jgi:hypothetical protein
MKKTVSIFAMMACLASSFAFAGDKAKRAKSAEDGKASTEASTEQSSTEQQNYDTSSSSAKSRNKAKKKTKSHAKPTPSEQEKEFDRALLGIYG